MNTADEIAQSRPPDSVTYTEWEWDPEDTAPLEKREFVAVETTLFKVLKYEEVVRLYQRQRRKRIERWHEAARSEIVASATAGGEIAAYDVVRVPAASVGRWEWEYRREWRLR